MSSFDRDFKRNFEAVEETVVLDGDIAAKLLERRPPGDPELAQEHRLLVIDPSEQEWEYPIRGEVLIGRSEENQIMLEDRAVSRHHLAINTDGKLYWFQDLNSGNGTQLNGEYVHEGWLIGGEELLIGNSHIYFLVPDILPESEIPEEAQDESEIADAQSEIANDQSNSQKSPSEFNLESNKKWLIPTLIVFMLGIGMSVIGAWWVYQKYVKVPPKIKQENPLKKAMRFLEKGKLLIAQKRWREADRLLRQAASEIPSSNPMRTIILEKVTQVGQELTAQTFFKHAKKLYLQEDKGKKALALLKKISKATQTYHDAQKLHQRIFNKDIKPIIREITILLMANKPNEAKKRLAELLKYDETLPAIIAIRDKVESTPKVAPPPKIVKTPTQPRKRPSHRRKSHKRKRFSANIRQGINYFRAGEITRAIIFFRRLESGGSSRRIRRKAKRYRRHAQTFQRNLSRGKRLARRNNTRAASLLLKAHYAARALGGGNRSKYASILAKMLYKRGQASHRRKRYVAAYRDYKRALSFRSNYPQVKAAIKKLQRGAKELYNQAMVLKDVDNQEARKLFLQVLKMLPRSSALYRKAKGQL